MTLVALVSLGILLATWIGYPVVIRVLGALRRSRTHGAPPASQTVSVIIASNNDAGAINARVNDVLAGDFPAAMIEVIVALDATTARATPADFAGCDPRLRVIHGDLPGGKACSLNAAVREARNDLLVFTDTAQSFAPNAITALTLEFTDASLGATSGMLEIRSKGASLNLAERYWRYERWLRAWESRVDSTVGVTGAIYAMRRALWTPLRPGLLLDDVYVPMRLVLEGWRVGFTPTALAFDARRFTPKEEYHRKVRTLTGNIQLCAWLPAILNPVRNRLFLQFVFHKLMRLLTPYLTLAFAISASWVISRAIIASELGLRGFAMIVAAGIALCLVPPVRRRVQSQLAWGLALQSSTFVATINGIRGRWEVWR